MQDTLAKYLPENAIQLYMDLHQKFPHQLHIKRKRISKLGDYRPPQGKFNYHRISVNGDLNPYSFLITLVHEVGHLIAWEKYKLKIKPHGKEWKNIYSEMLYQFVKQECFPETLLPEIFTHLNKPGASSCVDVKLQRALKKYDEKAADIFLLEELPFGANFITYNGEVFKKLEKIRKRYKCQNLQTKKMYAVSPIAEVKLFE